MTTGSVEIAIFIQFMLFGGAVLGMVIASRLSPDHLSSETKTLISTSMAVVGTMSALVIGLLISSGSAAFKVRNGDVALIGTQIVQLDSLLRRYGPEAGAARVGLQHYATMKFDDLFPGDATRRANVNHAATLATLDDVQDRVLALRPQNDRQNWLKDQALRITVSINETRARLARENVGAVPIPFLGAVVLWLTVLFASFGLFAPRNATALTVVFLCAVSISSAVKLVLDMDTPFEGHIRLTRPPIQISSDPLRRAIETIRR